MQRLHDEGVISGQKFDEAAASHKGAQGALNEVNSYLVENKIVAPIDGEITQINAEVGELVGSGFPLISVADLNDIWFTFNMREDLLPKIKIGTKSVLSVPALGEKGVEVEFRYISPLGNFATHRATRSRGDFDLKTFEVRAYPVEKTDGLRAGMSAVFDWYEL
jgi:HlyD family secretion protein